MDRFINEDAHKKIRPDSSCSAIFSLDISKEGDTNMEWTKYQWDNSSLSWGYGI